MVRLKDKLSMVFEAFKEAFQHLHGAIESQTIPKADHRSVERSNTFMVRLKAGYGFEDFLLIDLFQHLHGAIESFPLWLFYKGVLEVPTPSWCD